jgi:hypothetical protein
LVARDKASLDIFWLKDDSFEDSDNLPAPGVLAQEIVEDLQAALEQFRLIAEDLGEKQLPIKTSWCLGVNNGYLSNIVSNSRIVLVCPTRYISHILH